MDTLMDLDAELDEVLGLQRLDTITTADPDLQLFSTSSCWVVSCDKGGLPDPGK